MQKGYYKNCNIDYETTYDNGKKNGWEKIYYDNGNIEEEIYYKNGYIDGIQKKYNEEGILFATIDYKNPEKKHVHTYLKDKLCQDFYIDKEGKNIDSLIAYRPNGDLYYKEYYLENRKAILNPKENPFVSIKKDSNQKAFKQFAYPSLYYEKTPIAQIEYYDEQGKPIINGKHILHNEFSKDKKEIILQNGNLSMLTESFHIPETYYPYISGIKTYYKNGFVTNRLYYQTEKFVYQKIQYQKGNKIYAYPYSYKQYEKVSTTFHKICRAIEKGFLWVLRYIAGVIWLLLGLVFVIASLGTLFLWENFLLAWWGIPYFLFGGKIKIM